MTTKTTTPAIVGCYPAPSDTPFTLRGRAHRSELRSASTLLRAVIDYTPGGDAQPLMDALWGVLLSTGEESISVAAMSMSGAVDVVSAIHAAARLVTEITDDPAFDGDERLWLLSSIMEDLQIPRVDILDHCPFQRGRAPYRPC
jgi:hypothetical protein